MVTNKSMWQVQDSFRVSFYFMPLSSTMFQSTTPLKAIIKNTLVQLIVL